MTATEVVAVAALWILTNLVSWLSGRALQRRRDTPRMRPLCEELVPFIDGELPRHVEREFRDHLKRCPVCQHRMPAELQLGAQLTTLGKGDV